MSHTQATIRTLRGTRTVDAYPCGVPGLVISKAWDAPGWVITHARSGYGVAWFTTASPEAVLAAARNLGELTDWTQNGPAVEAEVTGDEVDSAVQPWGGKRWRQPDPSGLGPADLTESRP